jgi:hypothetical protein
MSYFSSEQIQLLFSLYEQYDKAQTCIDLLVEQQSSIRTMITTIQSNANNMNMNGNQRRQPINTNANNTSRSFRRNQRRSFSNNASVFYDYNDPIQPQRNSRQETETERETERERETDTLFRGRTPTGSALESFINNFLNTTVAIRPSISQINTATRIIRYGDINEPTAERCPISLEPFTPQQNVRQIIHCQHLFCEQSFQEWFSNHVQCPVCRYDIRDYIPITREQSRTHVGEDVSEDNRSENVDVGVGVTEDISSDFNPSIENINYIRDPVTNAIDTVVFDIVDNGQANELLSNVSNNLLQSLFQNPLTRNTTMSDASASMFVYETIWRPHH